MRIIRSRYLTSLFCICLVLLAGCNSSLPQQQSATVNTTLTIFPSQNAIPVSPSMVGMNVELSTLCTLLRLDAAHPAAFEQLFTNFGPSTLHIGGHSTDESIWQPDGKPSCGQHPVITQS